MLVLLLILLFILGLAVGSFLNVVIYRLEGKKRKSLRGRSFCPRCEKQISWHDNIPLISWLILGGKCRSCKKEISAQYPLVELATGILFSLVGWFYLLPVSLNLTFFDSGQARMTNGTLAFSVIPVLNLVQHETPAGIQSFSGIFDLLFWFFFTSCLIVIFVYDLKHQIIPDEIIYSALIAGLIYVGANTFLGGNLPYLYDHLLSGLIAGGFFYIFAAVSNGKWMGGGDIKLGAFMGLVLGWQGTLVALYFAFVLGAVVGITALLTGKKKMGSKIPFGPFLIAGTFIGLLFADKIISFYAKMFM